MAYLDRALTERQAATAFPAGVPQNFWRDFAVALSLANLCYLRVWSELLTFTRTGTDLTKDLSTPAEFATCMLNVLLVGAALALLTQLDQRSALWAARCAFLLSLLLPLRAFRAIAANHFPFIRLCCTTSGCGIRLVFRYVP